MEGIELLVSWNFEDVVNLRTKRLLPMLAGKHGYFKLLTIVSPQEFSETAQ